MLNVRQYFARSEETPLRVTVFAVQVFRVQIFCVQIAFMALMRLGGLRRVAALGKRGSNIDMRRGLRD